MQSFGLRHNSEYARAREMLREEALVAVYSENDQVALLET